MPVSTKVTDALITSRSANNLSSLEILQLSDIINELEEVVSVADSDQLPSAIDNAGRFIYLNDINQYRYSDGYDWTNCYLSTCVSYGPQIWTWGTNNTGQLASNDSLITLPRRSSPAQEISRANDWCHMTGSCCMFAAVKTDGTAWSWGAGGNAEMFGCFANYSSPVQETRCSFTTWSEVSMGSTHGVGILTDGSVYAWGYSPAKAFLNPDTGVYALSPVREVTSATDWCLAEATPESSFLIKTNGTMYAGGYNIYGKLGVGDTVSHSSPVQEVTSATDWKSVTGSCYNTAAIKTNGTMFVWGLNLSPNSILPLNITETTTDNPYSSPVQEITSATDWCLVKQGEYTGVAVKSNGTLWAWGHGALGMPLNCTAICYSSPVQEITSATNWSYDKCSIANSVFDTSSLALKTDGTLWGWGENYCGRLGTNNQITYSSPVQETTSSNDWVKIAKTRGASAGIRARIRGFNE